MGVVYLVLSSRFCGNGELKEPVPVAAVSSPRYTCTYHTGQIIS